MRLTVDLIARAPAYVNPLKDRELDLRGILFATSCLIITYQTQYNTTTQYHTTHVGETRATTRDYGVVVAAVL
jgi:hypothetical protein